MFVILLDNLIQIDAPYVVVVFKTNTITLNEGRMIFIFKFNINKGILDGLDFTKI